MKKRLPAGALAFGLVCASGALFGAQLGVDSIHCLAERGALVETHAWRVWAATTGAVATVAAICVFRTHLGRPGARGLLRSSLYQTYLAFFAALIAGTLIAPLTGTLCAPLVLFNAMVEQPSLSLRLAINMVVTYGLMTVWHQEYHGSAGTEHTRPDETLNP